MSSDPLFIEKASIREKMLRLRQELGAGDLQLKSRQIAQNLLGLKEFDACRDLLIFISLQNEVQTKEIIYPAFQRGKSVHVPVVSRESGELKITRLPSLEIDFKKGPYGVLEPEGRYWDFISPEDLDLIVTPGLAFDCEGGRLGYGKGYFDKLFRRSRAVRAAVAFDFQVLPSVPRTERDMTVDVIITESRTIRC